MTKATHERADDETQRSPGFVSSEVPLYYQLATLLREKILSGQYSAGDQVPTEAEMVKEYGVSRITVRQAMGSLADEGLIRREAGRGTFVTDLGARGDTLELDQSIEELISWGLATSVSLLDCAELPANRAEAEELGIPEDSPLLRCKRLRYYGDDPYCFILNRMPMEIGRRIPRERWEQGSVLHYIEEGLGIPLRIARQRFRATLADANLARWLQVRIGAPLLLVDYLIRTDEDRPVEMAQLYYRSDIYSFTLHLTRGEGEESEGKGWALTTHRLEP